jgi:hypothetical protein
MPPPTFDREGGTQVECGSQDAGAFVGSNPGGPPRRWPLSERRVTRPEPSVGAKNVGKRWATRQDLRLRPPGFGSTVGLESETANTRRESTGITGSGAAERS